MAFTVLAESFSFSLLRNLFLGTLKTAQNQKLR